MPVNFSIKHYHKSISGKIVLSFFFGCIAVLLALGITRHTFRQMLGTVNQLSQPDPKLQLVNNVFRSVIKLDQWQRTQSLQAPAKPYYAYVKQSRRLQLMLDTLRTMSNDNAVQVRRIDSMKSILYERDKLFISYLQLHFNLIKNDTLAAHVEALSNEISNSALNIDSLITTERKTTTTITGDSAFKIPEKISFWSRLFHHQKPADARQIQKLVHEELNIRIDTLSVTKEDSLVKNLGDAISHQESNRQNRHNLLSGRQMQLTNAGTVLISQLLSILQDLETQEIRQSEQKNATATGLVNTDLQRLDIVLIIFVLGTTVLTYLIFTDISNSNKYRKQLIESKEEAEQLGQVKQRFLSNMSHELRTPLQTIIGVAEQSRMKANIQPNDLEIIYQSSRHLLQIVNEVLDYSRIVSGKFSFDSIPFDMKQLISDIQKTIEVQAHRKGLEFICVTDLSEKRQYTGDPFRLKQILYNLTGNAIKFTNDGSVSLEVAHKDFPDHAVFIFKVKDTGIGISEQDLRIIFNQFEQAATPGYQHKGTGLGLNIVQALVQTQKGNIEVSSSPGNGSTFTITLSFATIKETEVHETVKKESSPAAYKGYVWIVDDDVFILQLCSGILSKYNIPHQCFSSAQATLNTSFDSRITHVLLDIRMPEMDGVELCHRLKTRTGSAQPEFIALTAQALPDEKDLLLQKGFDGLLMKPFMEQDFMQLFQVPQQMIQQKDTFPPIDLSAIEKMTGNDVTLIKETCVSFITETEKDLDKLRLSITRKEYLLSADMLHRTAGRYGQIGAKQIARQLRETEMMLRKDGYFKDKDGQLSDLCNDMQTMVNHIKQHITAL